MNGPRASRDFEQFKSTLSKYGVISFEQACLTTVQDIGAQFPDFATLAMIALVIPVSSVPCERGFSTQNQIKTEARNRLSEDRVARLMTLNIHGKTIEKFNFSDVSTVFRAVKKRRK